MKCVWLPESIGTSLDPPWSDLELHLCGDEFLRIKEFLGRLRIAKSWITCDNTNRNTTLSKAQGVSLRITSGVRELYTTFFTLAGKLRWRRRSWVFDLNKSDICPSFVEGLTAKGLGLRVADSHTGNHLEDSFTPLETIQSYVPAWFETDMYFVTYHNYVKPVPGMNFWPDQSMYSTVLPPKPRKILGRPRKKRIRSVGKGGSSTRVSKIVLIRDKGTGGSRGGAKGSRGGASVSRRVGGGSRGGSSVSGGASGSTGRVAGESSGASGSRGRGASGSGSANGSRGRSAIGSKRKHVSSAETQKRQGKKKVGTSGFAKWFGLQDEDQVQTQDEPVQTQDEDQMEQTQEQAEVDLTQVEQTQEQTQDQVQPQEQPQQVTLRTPSAIILQKKLGKQGSSQNTALNVDV
ncbi:hypothetical protein Tco_0512089 [Tanacetum coccineum]